MIANPSAARPPDSAPAPLGPSRPASVPTRRWSRSGGLAALLAALALLASGALRARQFDRIQNDLRAGLEQTIRLEDIPMELGGWKGVATRLDPEIARITGATQIVTRRYVNQMTGVTLDVILLFGRAVDMYYHSPENCYPAAGYGPTDSPQAREIQAGAESVPFRALWYAKGEGDLAEHQEVYYTWRYNSRWSPDVVSHKYFERIPGMYKIHVARRIKPSERRGIGTERPCESFLQALLAEFEHRLASSASPKSAPVSASPST